MNSLGEERKNLGCVPTKACTCDDCKKEKGKEEKKIHYPRETFTTDQLPSLSDAKLGDKVTLTIVAEVCAIKAGSEYEYEYENESEKNKTRITVKMLEGSVKKMDNKKQTPAEDTETTTVKEKQKQSVSKFDEMINDDSDDNE